MAPADRPARDRAERAGGCLLTINAGSSSIKFAIFPGAAGDRPIFVGLAERIGTLAFRCTLRDEAGETFDLPPPDESGARSHQDVFAWLLPKLQQLAGDEILAAGHRIVHGGARFSGPTILDDEAIAALAQLVPLARTHQPHNLAAVNAVRTVWPSLVQVGSFDTAFHTTIPEISRRYALPESITSRGVRRYGFHGLSYRWIASQLPRYLGSRADGRVIVAHLGNGSSLCGLVGLASRATSMGFTPLDGLVMGERAGSLDPGIVLFLFEELGMSATEVHNLLFRGSGLKGVSGLSNDMRTLLASDAPAASLAVDLYVHRAVREIGAIAAEIAGVDALVFTAGVGENAPEVRARIVEGCRWLGAELDPARNAAHHWKISPDGAKVAAYVVPTNEEAVIAGEMRTLLL